ncbi:MAG: helix-turn-helix domain-containing protein [Solirubrobacteraceae bacterium]
MAEHTTTTPGSDEDPWLTVPQVSQELKLHPATIRAWVKTGRLAAVRAGRTWRVRRSEVDRALRADASPAYARQEASSPGGTVRDGARTPAPRQMADHIMTVSPQPSERL